MYPHTMLRVALATSSKYSNLTADDSLLLAPLAERGVQGEAAVWDDPAVDWSSFNAVVLRSCWDYHLKPEAFLRWISSLEQAGIPLWNSAALVRWNADKSYLRALDTKGISIVPTFWPQGRDELCLRDVLVDLGWQKAVVKPRISATAYRTHVVAAADADSMQELFDDLRRGPGAMVQQFMDAVVSEGEWSLMYCGGMFNHAVLKTPQAGDFRVQSDFGGAERAAEPPGQVLQSANLIIESVEPTLYARVDGVVDGGQFRLMELELIEPALFLKSYPGAARRFADAIVAAVESRITGPRFRR